MIYFMYRLTVIGIEALVQRRKMRKVCRSESSSSTQRHNEGKIPKIVTDGDTEQTEG